MHQNLISWGGENMKKAKKDKKKIPLKIKNMQHDDKKSNMRVSWEKMQTILYVCIV